MGKYNIKFHTEPKVFRVGETAIRPDGLRKFAEMIQDETGKPPSKLMETLRSNYTEDYEAQDLMTELAGRVCYQSYFSGRNIEDYIAHIVEAKHGSVMEHSTFNYILTGVSRSLTHELIRHRVGVAISEMSQRFVGANEKSGTWNFVVPAAVRDVWDKDEGVRRKFEKMARRSVQDYLKAKELVANTFEGTAITGTDLTKRINEAAREVLPNWVETRMVWTVNLRTLRHFLTKRGDSSADRQIRLLALALYDDIVRNGTTACKPLWLDDAGLETTDLGEEIIKFKIEGV